MLRHSEQTFPLISTLVGIWNHGYSALGRNCRGSSGSSVPLAYAVQGDGGGGIPGSGHGQTLVGSLHATPEHNCAPYKTRKARHIWNSLDGRVDEAAELNPHRAK